VKKMEELRVADTITEIFNLFKRCNKYIDETEPWVLAKDEAKKDRLATVLYNLTESISIGANLLRSFMPETAEKILTQLNVESRDFETLATFGAYPSGNKVTQKPEILFARLDEAEVLAKVEELYGVKEEEKAEETVEGMDVEEKPIVTYDDFAKLQFRIGKVLSCEEVPKSKKLLLFKVQIGNETRQILSGIKKYYKPEEMVGKNVMVLTNLAPRTIAGLESQGMILSAEDDEDHVFVMTPDKDIKPGAEVC